MRKLFTRTILSKRSTFAGKSAYCPLTSVSQACMSTQTLLAGNTDFFNLICINKSNESERCWGKNSAKYQKKYFLIDPATDGLSDCSTHCFASSLEIPKITSNERNFHKKHGSVGIELKRNTMVRPPMPCCLTARQFFWGGGVGGVVGQGLFRNFSF